MKFFLIFVSWMLMFITSVTMFSDLVYFINVCLNEDKIILPDLYFRIFSLFSSFIVIYIFWNVFQYLKKRKHISIKHIGWGLILDAVISGASLFLPQNLYQNMKISEFSDFQISLTYYLAFTPGGFSGAILGLLMLFIIKNKKEQ